MQSFQKLFILVACKLASLIRVENCRGSEPVHSAAGGFQDGLYAQSVGEIPSHNLSAAPIDDGSEIHVTAVQFDVGDVNRPDLI